MPKKAWLLLHENLNSLISSADSYAKFFIMLLKKIDNLSNIGHAIIQRKTQVLEILKKQYDILDQRFNVSLGKKSMALPYALREELYMNADYKNSDFYKVECMNDLGKYLKRDRHCTFFMWPINHIRYYLTQTNLSENVFNLIDELSSYYDTTCFHWDEFSKINNIQKPDWIEEFRTLKCDFYEELNSALFNKISKKSKLEMYSVSKIQIHIDSKAIDIKNNVLEFINDLSNYYNSTVCFQEEFTKLNSTTMEQWYLDLIELINSNDIYQLLVSDFTANGVFNYDNNESFYQYNIKLQKILSSNHDSMDFADEINIFRSYKIKLTQLLLGRQPEDIFEMNNRLDRLSTLFPPQSQIDEDKLNQLILDYVRESLYHVNIFEAPANNVIQYILKLHILLMTFKFYYFPHSNIKSFVNDLFDIINNKLNANEPLNILDVIELVSFYTNDPNLNSSILNNQLTTTLSSYYKNQTEAGIKLRDEVVLLLAHMVQKKDYYLPSNDTDKSAATLHMQDIKSENINRVMSRMYISKSKVDKFHYACLRTKDIISKVDEFMLTIHENTHPLNSLKSLYDSIIISLLHGLPMGLDLREKYEDTLVPKLDNIDAVSLAALLNLGKKSSVNLGRQAHMASLDELVAIYFYAPIADSKSNQAFDDPIYSIIFRQAILKKLNETFINIAKAVDFTGYSDEYLDYLCELLDNASLSLEMINISNKNNSSLLLYYVNRFHDFHQSLFNTNCLPLSKIRGLKFALKGLAILLGLSNDQKIMTIDAWTRRSGWVITNLCDALLPNENMMQTSLTLIEQRIALKQVMKLGEIHLKSMQNNQASCHSILFKLLMNEGAYVSEVATVRYLEQSPVIQMLKEVCLPRYIFDADGHTLLYRAVEYNFVIIVRWLLGQNHSLLQPNKQDLSTPQYLYQCIAPKTTDKAYERKRKAIMMNKYHQMINDILNMMRPEMNNSNLDAVEYFEAVEIGIKNYEIILNSLFAQFTNIVRDKDILAEREIVMKELRDISKLARLNGYDLKLIQDNVVAAFTQINIKVSILTSRFLREMNKSLLSKGQALISISPSPQTQQALSQQEIEKLRLEKEAANKRAEEERTEKEAANLRADEERTEKKRRISARKKQTNVRRNWHFLRCYQILILLKNVSLRMVIANLVRSKKDIY